jgi:hypothetical protein
MATKTFGNLKTEIARFVKMPADTEVLTICGEAVNNAVDSLINIRNWSFQMATSGFTLVADDNTYPVPTDFREQRNVSLMNTAGEVGLRVGYEEPKIFDTKYNRGSNSTVEAGHPSHYTITDPYPSGVIRFDRTPDAGVVADYPTAEIMYYARVGEMSADSDVLSLPPEVESMVSWYAKSYVAAIFAYDQVPYAESRWNPLWRQLKRNESSNADWNSRGRR